MELKNARKAELLVTQTRKYSVDSFVNYKQLVKFPSIQELHKLVAFAWKPLPRFTPDLSFKCPHGDLLQCSQMYKSHCFLMYTF